MAEAQHDFSKSKAITAILVHEGAEPALEIPNVSDLTSPALEQGIEEGRRMAEAEVRALVFNTYSATREQIAALLKDFPGYPAVMSTDIDTGKESPMMIGDLVVSKLLGQGGLGKVYLAQDPKLDRQVVVKVLNPSVPANGKYLTPEEIEVDQDKQLDFIREMRILAKQIDINVVRIDLAGQFTDPQGKKQLFTVMEYCPNGNLLEYAKNKQFLASPEAKLEKLEVLKERALPLVRSMDRMHQEGIIHGDVKPENVLVDASGNWKFGDFGYAQMIEHARHSETHVFGTPRYLPPEYAGGLVGTHSPASDWYAFAISMFEVFTGQIFFEGMNDKDIMDALYATVRNPDGGEKTSQMKGFSNSTQQQIKSKLETELTPHIADLLRQMLDADVAKRIPPDQVLKAWGNAIYFDEALLATQKVDK